MRYKVKFKQLENSKIINKTYSYYEDETDFKDRNPTLHFMGMTTVEEPPPKEDKKKED